MIELKSLSWIGYSLCCSFYSKISRYNWNCRLFL